MLKQTFIELAKSFTTGDQLAEQAWSEIESAYSNKSRHYHTLTHLENLLSELTEIKNQISDWNTVLFALYYHDIVYNTLKNNNEEKSAKSAEKRMLSMKVPEDLIEKCKEIILATKSHALSVNNDANIFTDADLSILGKEWETYSTYYKQVRMEYSIYPDLIYNGGRKKVLSHFLQMERIFKTDHFYHKFEHQARQNIKSEFSVL